MNTPSLSPWHFWCWLPSPSQELPLSTQALDALALPHHSCWARFPSSPSPSSGLPSSAPPSPTPQHPATSSISPASRGIGQAPVRFSSAASAQPLLARSSPSFLNFSPWLSWRSSLGAPEQTAGASPRESHPPPSSLSSSFPSSPTEIGRAHV